MKAAPGIIETASTSETAGAAKHATQRNLAMINIDPLPGLALAVVIPTLFWPATVWAIGQGLGYTLALSTLVMLGSAIAVFLTIVCGAIMLRD